MIKYDYIIYHRGCIDGFTGFFISFLSGDLTKDVYIHPDVPSATKVPPKIKNKNVLIVDVAYNKILLEKIIKEVKSLVFIDHHKSIKEDVEELYKKYNNNNSNNNSNNSKNIKIIYDSKMCGATLAWNFFNKRKKIPLFLKYIQDQDTGTWEYPETEPFIFGLKTYYHLNPEYKSLNKWFKLLDENIVQDIIHKGKIIQKYNQHLTGVNVRKHSLLKFPSQKIYNMKPKLFNTIGQYNVAVFCGLNCPTVTDLANKAFQRIDCDFTLMWTYNIKKKEYVISMRSKNVDVSEIAKLFNGGGHKLAAAGSFTNYSIDDLFSGSVKSNKQNKRFDANKSFSKN
jgi:hypothetical protein